MMRREYLVSKLCSYSLSPSVFQKIQCYKPISVFLITNATNLKTEVVVQFRNHRSHTSTNKTCKEYEKTSNKQQCMRITCMEIGLMCKVHQPEWSVLVVYRQAVHRSRLLGQTWSCGYMHACMGMHPSITTHPGRVAPAGNIC